MKISEGLHELPARDYHADPAPEPSLSSSMIRLMLERSPAHVMAAHPRLWDEAPEPSAPTRQTEIGSVAHALVLGAGAKIRIIDAADYRTSDAKTARAEAYEAGHLPILTEDYSVAAALRDVARERLSAFGLAHVFDPARGVAERCGIWRERDTWGRALFDWIDTTSDPRTITCYDLKTTDNASPHTIGRHILSMGYHVQASWYRRGLGVLFPDRRVQFRFVFFERDAPHGMSVVELDEAWLELGRRQVATALALWTSCISSGEWPLYRPEIVRVEAPVWAERDWMQRETAPDMPDFGPFLNALKAAPPLKNVLRAG